MIYGSAVSSKVRVESNVSTHVGNRPPVVMHSHVNIHRYSVANILYT